ncbi:hypothetical protein V865_006385 [Kwoniella europaea PYCC6329]|uniref:RNA helicase n=1 Tax=Kwoniella europaea PYCC6329 TaxID=1423913 RepID=A0AAX4KQP8_9TREE
MIHPRLSYPSRISHIALTTPPLRSILIRALHATSTSQAGGPRTAQPGRPSRGSSFKQSTNKTSFGVKPSFGQKPAFGKKPSFDGQSRYPAFRSNDAGKIHPTSSRRLASFDEPRKPHRSSRHSTAAEEDASESIPSSPRFPKSQPFQPPSYPSTPTLADPTAASPRPFDAFNLSPGLLQSLTSQYAEDGKTTPIQSLSFANILPTSSPTSSQGQRVILGAETGSGKTMSYLVPLFQHLKSTEQDIRESEEDAQHLYPRSIILSPTHELTRQSTRFAKSLTHTTKLSVMGLSNTAAGGVGARRGTVDVLLGTVGSVRRMLGIRKDQDQDQEENEREDIGSGLWKKEERNGLVRSDKLEWVVIDEADVLLGSDFLDETLSILSKIPLSSQINLILCTATLPPSLLNLLSSHPLFSSTKFTHLLSPGLHKLPTKLETRFVPPSRTGNRLADVAHEVRRVFADDALKSRSNLQLEGEGDKEKSKIIVFCNSDKKVEQLSKTLESKGLHCLNWTSESQYRQRGRNGPLDSFLMKSVPQQPRRKFQEQQEQEEGTEKKSTSSTKSSSSSSSSSSSTPRILVTTSLLSRGLDFSPSVSSVFLLDPPRDVLDFVHRAGRAGRAGREGRVVVFGLGDGSGIGKSTKKNGKELQVGEVLGKTQIRRQMLGGRVKRARL